MKKILFVVLLSACSAGGTNLIGPDGTEHKLLSCGTIEGCYEKARKACGGNYLIVNTSSESRATEGGVLSSQKLLVKCVK